MASPRATLAVAAFVAGVSALTVLQLTGEMSRSALASSPHQIAEGKLWLLITSGLVVQAPVVLSLASFAVLAFAVLIVCSARVLWYSAVLGHVLSTLALYGLIGTFRLADPDSFASLVSRPDYGVSAISAAWLGAIAATAWQRRGNSLRERTHIVLSCAAIGAFAWMVKRHLNILDTDHVVAFSIGVTLASNRARVALATLRRPALA
jgi:hypothetical protein